MSCEFQYHSQKRLKDFRQKTQKSWSLKSKNLSVILLSFVNLGKIFAWTLSPNIETPLNDLCQSYGYPVKAKCD